MKVVVVAALLLCARVARAEQPRGTYLFDRGSLTTITDEGGRPLPSCGGAKVYGGQATFRVEYGKTILVNGHVWRFFGYTFTPGYHTSRPTPDAGVVISDPDSQERIQIAFFTDGHAAAGYLRVMGQRNGTACTDGWELTGTFTPPAP